MVERETKKIEKVEKVLRVVRRKKKYPIEALYIVGAVAFFLGALFVWHGAGLTKTEVATLSEQVAVLEDVARATGGQVQALSLELQMSSTTREEQERLFEEKFSLLSTNVSSQQSQLESVANATDVSRVAKEWSPFVYRLACFFKIKEDTEREDRGSATIENIGAGTRVVTSKHIIERKDGEFLGCTLTQPNSTEEIKIKPTAFIKVDAIDYAYAFLGAGVSAMPESRWCTSRPNIGDQVLILGYPGIGAKESVTATEGIISGFDADLYTTSAKIEKGNSGGAVVDVRRNCFLGIPTSVLPGNVESLARILPVLGL